ncbi:hypothetical protein Cadr_000012326 [Camelus dromedarius]|uniref:Uncharacterized protein n=1 Tax=Camelus dromedarius TaxID=9838 RepID=A0A5N4DQ90_CAMDR|nr:hypothetical protein Cadr_000012326 [Camelus dromedarius]
MMTATRRFVRGRVGFTRTRWAHFLGPLPPGQWFWLDQVREMLSCRGRLCPQLRALQYNAAHSETGACVPPKAIVTYYLNSDSPFLTIWSSLPCSVRRASYDPAAAWARVMRPCSLTRHTSPVQTAEMMRQPLSWVAWVTALSVCH